MAIKQQQIVASLDIGSNKIVCLIGYINSSGKIFIKGVGHQQSKGIHNGKIVNKKEMEKNILSTISLAEKIAGFNINSITINTNSSQLQSSIINNVIKLNNREVKTKDIISTLKEIKNILRKNNEEIVHLIPLQYILDETIVEDPYNIKANELKIRFHLLSTKKANLAKIDDCLKNIMLKVNNYVSNGYATSLAVLEEKEKELGVLVLDIGHTNTDIGLIYDNRYLMEDNIPIAGEHITKDISSILRVTQTEAEKIKIINTNFALSRIEEEDLIKINYDTEEEDFLNSAGNVKLINDITKARIEEIVLLAIKKVKENNLEQTINYIVLTGGTASIPGINIFINNLTGIDTRIGYNEKIEIQDKKLQFELKSPVYSVSMGIMSFIQSKYMDKSSKDEDNDSSFFLSTLKSLFGF